MGQLIDWSLRKIDGIPPIPFPFLVALAFVFVLLLPTIRRAWRAQGHKPQADEALPVVQLNAGGVYTVLVNLQIQVEKLHAEINVLGERLLSLERLLRKRKDGGKKSRPNGSA